jgi:thiamine biosynthesis lipoprotein
MNHSAGGWARVSPDLYEIVAEALRLHAQTRGLFDPSILGALENAGYDRSIELIRTFDVPRKVPTAAVRPEGKFGETRLDPDGPAVWLPEGMRLDLGGIAKGWIAERAALRLAEFASACTVDAGGDAFMVGRPADEDAWRVTLEDPCEPNRGLAILKLGPGAVATSAVTRRRWTQAGETRHHLIDPRTGRPAVTDWQSVTAFAPHAAEAEVYAKSLLIGGASEALRLSSGPDSGLRKVEFIAVDYQNKLWGSPHSREVLDV